MYVIELCIYDDFKVLILKIVSIISPKTCMRWQIYFYKISIFEEKKIGLSLKVNLLFVFKC